MKDKLLKLDSFDISTNVSVAFSFLKQQFNKNLLFPNYHYYQADIRGYVEK